MRATIAFLVLLFITACDRATPEPPPDAAETRTPRCTDSWVAIGNGIDYRTIRCGGRSSGLHLVRVDPKIATFESVAGGLEEARGAAQARGWKVAINANFFDESFRPLGAVNSEGKQLNRLHNVSWQSLFVVTRDREPRIVLPETWGEIREEAMVAVQAGPRLVADREPLKLKPAPRDWRAGVCIDERRNVLLFATDPETQLSVDDAVAFAANDLPCADAMLFDGGPSVQLFVATDPPVEVTGDKRVPVFLGVR